MRWAHRKIVAAILTALLGACSKPPEPAAKAAPPPPVRAVILPLKPVAQAAPVLPETMAELVATQEQAVVAPRASYLVRQLYQENQFVKAGEPLFQADLREAHSDGKCELITVNAPVSGMPSAPLHGPGDRIEVNDLLAKVGRVDPISAKLFSKGEPNEKVTEFLKALAARPTTAPGPGIELILPDGSVYKEKGSWGGMTEDEKTSVIAITFPNPDHVLYPGEYVKVRSATP